MSIRTEKDWWAAVDEHWEHLLNIMCRFLPMNEHTDRDGTILEKPVWHKVVMLKEKRDIELARYFHSAWHAAPDVSGVHAIRSWGVLCDLCSEDYVLYEDLIP